MKMTDGDLWERASLLEKLRKADENYQADPRDEGYVYEAFRTVRDEAEVEGARTAANIWLDFFDTYAPDTIAAIRKSREAEGALYVGDMMKIVDAIQSKAHSEALEKAATTAGLLMATSVGTMADHIRAIKRKI